MCMYEDSVYKVASFNGISVDKENQKKILPKKNKLSAFTFGVTYDFRFVLARKTGFTPQLRPIYGLTPPQNLVRVVASDFPPFAFCL